ncbi:MAG: efflux RND transporter periplasmic adaptor subunit [Pseudomonadota bacterium]|nr:efflux RND transporter periplasmic adaptor subunit [Pseudomonadota bacterium]
MKKTLKIVLPFVFVIGATVLSINMFCAAPRPNFTPPEPPAVVVSVNEAIQAPVTFMVDSQGTVSARTRTTLVSEVSGQIIEVSPAFVSGGFFRKGDILVRIDPRNYQTALKRAQADVARAQTQVATESALAGYAYEDWKKLRELNAKPGDTPSDLTLRKPQMQEALAGLASQEAALEKAQEDLARTVIRAPYDGMVREKVADVGQYVNAGTQMAKTFAVDLAEIRLPITQSDLRYLDLPRLRDGGTLPVTLTSQIGKDTYTWEGKVVRSEGVFDEATRIMYVVAQVDDPYALFAGKTEPLRVGTFVTAQIEGVPGGDLIAVPRHALSRGTTLWVVDEESRIYPHDVQIVRTDEAFAYLSGGVDPGARYVSIPIDQPLPGQKVKFDG